MNNKLLLKRETSFFNAIFPFIASLLVLFISFIFGIRELSFYLTGIIVGILLILFTRKNAVKIYMYDTSIEFYFFIIKKRVKIPYENVKQVTTYQTVYEGITTKFVIINKNKKNIFRINKSDKEFIDLLRLKTNLKI